MTQGNTDWKRVEKICKLEEKEVARSGPGKLTGSPDYIIIGTFVIISFIFALFVFFVSTNLYGSEKIKQLKNQQQTTSSQVGGIL